MSAFAAPTNSSTAATTSSSTNANHARNEFEAQRADLVHEIALGMESVLQYINRLNRNLESIIAVGNEFSSVEALWSQFENVMGTENEAQSGAHNHHGGEEGEEQEEGDGQGEGRYNEERQTEKLDVKTEEEEEEEEEN